MSRSSVHFLLFGLLSACARAEDPAQSSAPAAESTRPAEPAPRASAMPATALAELDELVQAEGRGRSRVGVRNGLRRADASLIRRIVSFSALRHGARSDGPGVFLPRIRLGIRPTPRMTSFH